MEVRIQSVVVEFILNHVDVLFSGKISAVMQEGAGMAQMTFPCHQEQVPKGMENFVIIVLPDTMWQGWETPRSSLLQTQSTDGYSVCLYSDYHVSGCFGISLLHINDIVP